MRRLAALVSAAFLTLAIGVGLVAAATGMLSASGWVGGRSTGGGAFGAIDECQTQRGLGFEDRCAIEFDISGLPAGATINSATLSLRSVPLGLGCASFPCTTDVSGYSGDGVLELADLLAGSFLLTISAPNGSYQHLDVTPFVAGLHGVSDDWAGFRLSPPGAGLIGDRRFDNTEDEFPPILTIEYTLPAASVAASLNDAAMAPTSPGHPLIALGFGVLLIASLGGLAVAGSRRGR